MTGDVSWEDALDFLTRQMQDDLDKTVGAITFFDEVTGVPHFVLVVVGESEDDVSDKAGEILTAIGTFEVPQ